MYFESERKSVRFKPGPSMNPTPPNPEALLPWRRGGLVSSNDPESHAVGSIATVRASISNTSKGNNPVKKEYSGPPGDGVELEVDKLHPVKHFNCEGAPNNCIQKLEQE
jgi:hypothetical protein